MSVITLRAASRLLAAPWGREPRASRLEVGVRVSVSRGRSRSPHWRTKDGVEVAAAPPRWKIPDRVYLRDVRCA